MVSPSEEPASAAKKPPPPSDPEVAVAASAVASGSTTTEPTLQQKQLAEFNSWLFRWNNYQQHLATYWQGRYNALYAHTMTAAGGGKAKKTKSGKVKGNKTEMNWMQRYQELLEFREEHGHTNVPKEYTYKFSPPLGHWVGRQRYLHKTNTLKPDRLEKLETIGFEFVMKKSDSVKFSVVWDQSYQALKAFKDVNGHIEVPSGYKPQPDMANLDGWVARQRSHFKKGKLPDHLKDKLVGLGLNLGGRGRPFGIEAEDVWSTNYKALADYAAENGDADVPEKYDGDKELGRWVKEQREAFANGMLPEDRISKLNLIGFNFYHGRKSAAAKKCDPWQRRFSELKAYKEKTGTTNVPKKFSLNLGLGDFVFNQRMAYKDKILPDEKIKALEDLGFDFTIKREKKDKTGKVKKTIWESRFEELEEYKDKFGDLNVPDEYEPNPALAGWKKRQRKYQREGVLKKEKYERLKALGMNFGGPKQEKKPWHEQYKALADFHSEHGHVDVPVHYAPNPPLYFWIGTQRQSFKKGKLSDEKISLLNEIDFDFTIKPRDPSTYKKSTRNGQKPFLNPEEWEKLFHELEEWKEEKGNCDVPQRSGRLGAWVHYMRFYVKSGKLNQDQIDRLNSIGFSWNVTEDRWMARYRELAQYKEEHGSYEIDSKNSLYGWVQYQRKMNHEGSLPEDKVDLINKLGDFDWDVTPREKGNHKNKDPAAWESRFKDMVAFKDETGHCTVPPIYPSNPALAKWVASQKAKYAKGNLPEDKLERLNEIGFDFGPQWPKLGAVKVPQIEAVDRESYLEGLWERSYDELVAYKNHFGNCNIPISYDANPSLGAWAFSQRMAYKKGKLSDDRIEKLTELGFSFGPQKAGKSEEV